MTKPSLSALATAVLVSASLLSAPAAEAGSKKMWDNLSTGLALGVGAVAGVTTLKKQDNTGLKQLSWTLGSTLLITEALKATVHENRPDGSGNDGFPSGHTSMAFAAATYFGIRYGDQYPQYVPYVYGAAALTGIARVEAKKHYARDVLAGALLGWGMGKLITTPQNAELMVAPTAGGASVTYTKHF
ncbi:phosphatase PAP2 family protein [Acidimangrovimonas pyrenivorans]|uniref:Phosphatase PAP2 family protein n=1 Tax=Acidimangrovimonas pyrenivorans TaxID=2030798 RepID=A0ABV7AD13_9RHOB